MKGPDVPCFDETLKLIVLALLRRQHGLLAGLEVGELVGEGLELAGVVRRVAEGGSVGVGRGVGGAGEHGVRVAGVCSWDV